MALGLGVNLALVGGSNELGGVVGEGAVLAPTALSHLEVHAHLGLALSSVDATAAESNTLRKLPVGGAGVVVNVVGLSLRGGGLLPTRGELLAKATTSTATTTAATEATGNELLLLLLAHHAVLLLGDVEVGLHDLSVRTLIIKKKGYCAFVIITLIIVLDIELKKLTH